MIEKISVQLNEYKKTIDVCSSIGSKARIMKHFIRNVNNIYEKYRLLLTNYTTSLYSSWEQSNYDKLYALDMLCSFNCLDLLNENARTYSDSTSSGYPDINTFHSNVYLTGMYFLGKPNQANQSRIVLDAMEWILPNTDISVFEFLIMDLNLIHLPILNHEELMVEEFKELEHLIRGRCKKLKEIYDTHLIFNEKRSNFPEDCTNHILKYCQETMCSSQHDVTDCFEFL